MANDNDERDNDTNDSVTETTSQGWLSKLGDAFKGILIGMVMIVASFPLLFWNEGRAVKTAKSLAEGRGAVVTVSSERIDAVNEGKLVHTTGLAKTGETLADKDFGLTENAIGLRRKVEMYQWKETSRSEKKDKVGGSTETVTTYSYDREWSETLIDSSRFKNASGHQNPRGMAVKAEKWTAAKVTLGAFQLSPSQVAAIGGEEAVKLSADKAPPALPANAKPYGGGYYLGSDPQSPRVGDVRVTFFRVPEGELTVVAKQTGNSFQPYRAQAGGSVDLQRRGIASADDMFASAEQSNIVLTWILRAVGWLVMSFGIGLVLRPLSALASVLPILGDIIGAGTGIIAFLFGSVLSLVTVAIAWLAYRPLLGIGLLVLGGGAAYGIIYLVRKARASRIAAPKPA